MPSERWERRLTVSDKCARCGKALEEMPYVTEAGPSRLGRRMECPDCGEDCEWRECALPGVEIVAGRRFCPIHSDSPHTREEVIPETCNTCSISTVQAKADLWDAHGATMVAALRGMLDRAIWLGVDDYDGTAFCQQCRKYIRLEKRCFDDLDRDAERIQHSDDCPIGIAQAALADLPKEVLEAK